MILIALLLQSLSAPSPASPLGPPPPSIHGGPQQMTCPVGGERFSAWRTTMYSTYGERPDGKPYSYLPFPLPIPECPTNRLVVFDTFSDRDVGILTREIATPEYRRAVNEETSFYRAYRLSAKLGRPKVDSLGLLLAAIWQVSPGDMSQATVDRPDPRFARYQAVFVKDVQALDPALAAKDRGWLEARAANAARQLGRFDEAEALRTRAARSLTALPDGGRWATYLSQLQAVIARRDTSVEPLDMIPKQQIAYTCDRERPTDAFGKAVCARPEVVVRLQELRRMRDSRPNRPAPGMADPAAGTR